MREKYNKYTVY